MQIYLRSKFKKNGISLFSIFKYVPPLDPTFHLYILCVYTIYVYSITDLLGPVGHTLKLKLVMTQFFLFLTGNTIALIHVSMMRLCNKIKNQVNVNVEVSTKTELYCLLTFPLLK